MIMITYTSMIFYIVHSYPCLSILVYYVLKYIMLVVYIKQGKYYFFCYFTEEQNRFRKVKWLLYLQSQD